MHTLRYEAGLGLMGVYKNTRLKTPPPRTPERVYLSLSSQSLSQHMTISAHNRHACVIAAGLYPKHELSPAACSAMQNRRSEFGRN